MRIGMAVALAGLALAPAAATAQSIQSDWDRSYDFSKLHTYAYVAQTRGPRDPLSVNPLNDRRVRAALDSQLVLLGFTQSTGDAPDFFVAYHAATRDRLSLQEWGYGPGRWGNRRIDVNEYTEGTLVVDFISGTTKEMVWRGTATGAISPNEADKKIKNAVAKLAQRFKKDTKPKT
jgi:hypothetical protein